MWKYHNKEHLILNHYLLIVNMKLYICLFIYLYIYFYVTLLCVFKRKISLWTHHSAIYFFKLLHSIQRVPILQTFPILMNILISYFLLFQMCFRISLKDTLKIGISWLPLRRTNHRIDIWVWEGNLLFPEHPFILFEFFVCEKNNYNIYYYFLNLFILFIYVWSCWVFTAARGLSLVAACGATLRCGEWASNCGGFFCCRARALGVRASVVVVRRLSSCSWALESGLSSCDTRA